MIGSPARSGAVMAQLSGCAVGRREHGLRKRVDDLVDDRVVRHVARLHRDVGLRHRSDSARRSAAAASPPDRRLEQRPVAAALDPAHQHVEIGLEPDRDALVRGSPRGCSAFMKAPPPVASTCGPPSSRRAITRARRRENTARRGLAKISGMVMPAAFSISPSASTNGMPSRCGQPPADRGLAGAHHADQHDRAAAQRRHDGFAPPAACGMAPSMRDRHPTSAHTCFGKSRRWHDNRDSAGWPDARSTSAIAETSKCRACSDSCWCRASGRAGLRRRFRARQFGRSASRARSP